MNRIEQARDLGQSIWLDYMRRGLLASGELKRLVAQGVGGLTSNPTIFEKAIGGSNDYDQELADPAVACKDAKEIYETLILSDIRAAADLLRPVYDRTRGEDGYASLEPNPDLAYDTEATMTEVRRLWGALNRPNVMVKVPGTPQGMPVVRQFIGEGININITLIFSLDAYRQVREAYVAGLEDLARKGGDISQVASVASFFVSRVDTAVDTLLEERIRQGHEELRPLLGKAAIANSKLAYQAFKTTFASRRFAELRAKGARVQRVLWASTSTKNPAYPDLMYVESLIGRDTIDTLPSQTLSAFLDHGKAASTVEQDVEGAGAVLLALDAAGIKMDQVTANLLADGIKAFSDSLHALLTALDEKKKRLLSQGVAHPDSTLGEGWASVAASMADLKRRDVVARIWRKDHTVWKTEPVEITNRLGWLTVIEQMQEQAPRLKEFARGVCEAGFKHVVVLGMGGSSLGPEVARRTFGSAAGYPELLVLDSTVPAWVQAVARKIDPATALFLVSSKSGSTIESLSFYRYFRARADRAAGKACSGGNFVAITDPGAPLAAMAVAEGFRHIFLNPTDIGGRYSVLSYFGLVPMALTGIDIDKVLYSAERMCHMCASCVPLQGNPGAWLGSVIGVLAAKMQDKLTLLVSPSIASYGLWVEQLLAESTGKDRKGIVPVTGEPLASPENYGNDRLFVYLRLEGDDNGALDSAVERFRSAGHAVVKLDLRDKYDLGAEFFRWEFATAVAGSVLGVNPFDQPNVQQAKNITAGMLREYREAGKFPAIEASSSLKSLLDRALPGSYLAVLAYLNETPGLDRALQGLRRAIVERYHIATTLGYGPRYLHSSGQLHKGGPNTGLFLQITAARRGDILVPGQPYSFGVLTDAEALGDLQALQQSGRRVARIHLDAATEAAIKGITAQIAEPAAVR